MPLEHLDFTMAYEFADVVVAAVTERVTFAGLEDFVKPVDGDFWSKAAKPSKDTLLHDFIRNLNYQRIEIVLEEPDFLADGVIDLFTAGGVEVPTWLNREEIDDHLDELSDLVVDAIDVVTNATFQLLFSDVAFLASFHDLLAAKVRNEDRTGRQELFTTKGRLKRVTYIPVWLRKAVFHRDRGRCRHCGNDLTGTISLDTMLHLDHLLPLALDGTNDATNFQLLCGSCNVEKGAEVESGPWWTEVYW